MSKKALILFAHGARAASWAQPFQRLQQLTQQSLPDVKVELAFLELMQPQLPEAVENLVSVGYDNLTITPIFLGQGGHVLRDLPLMVDELRSRYPQIQIKQVLAAGEDQGVLSALRDYCLRSIE
ncbi:sirohydrochlorin chelatase [Undibacterium flavidum]|uniref:CbiX/SirB N-terminal domain-containing protein n=1 Tax=Undibacterium flavidum TaxID=2762297 RepID=A0ABR6Y880_9BURK|nr:CbiX/SirB N-terminal domain-containing protein [Undibacterium flavidum]MBC3872817.1 CbiX/SirB N-terminal domain-containing protein [Undibacterium flavidum]